MYLIDTVALSELRKRERDPGMVRWLRGKSADSLFLSVVTIGEIERGISSKKDEPCVRRGAHRMARPHC
jgi:predicted nucleic acid-binding protein